MVFPLLSNLFSTACLMVPKCFIGIYSGLRRCFTVNGIFKLLETIPADEVTPCVAVEALKLILTLESSPNATSQPHQVCSVLFVVTNILYWLCLSQGFFWAPSGRLWEAPGLRWAEILSKFFEFLGKNLVFSCFK